jgi:nitrate/nitrite-specific signal transduction histidine kinase
MTVRARIKLSILTLIIIIAVLGVAVYYQAQVLYLENQEISVATKMVQSLTSRRSLLLDYLRYHQERPKLQWQLQSELLSELTHSKFLTTAEELLTAKQIEQGKERDDSLFASLIEIVEKPELNESEVKFGEDLEKTLIGQLLITSQANIDRSYVLVNVSLNEINEAHRILVHEIITSVTLVSLFVIFLFLYFSKYIFKPLSKIQTGINKIKSGELSHKIDMESKDEFGAISGAFNEMSDELQKNYQNLEKQVNEKTVELRQKIGELEKMNFFMVDREVRMTELKKTIKDLEAKNK